MNKVKELRIDNTLWATPARLVNLLDFEPEKILKVLKNIEKVLKKYMLLTMS